MDALRRDVRYTLVMIRRNKSFAAAALLTLALGIGVTTAVFSAVYGVLLRPLPYPNADRLVRLSEEHPGAVSPLREPMLSNLTYYAWIGPAAAGGSPIRDARPAARTIDTVAAYRGREYTVALPGGSQRLHAEAVTPSLFPLVGAMPALGRFFDEGEGRKGADALLVLTDRAWRLYFAGDPGAVGRSVLVDGTPYKIVGVARPGFYFPDREVMFWTPQVVVEPNPAAEAGRRGPVSVVDALARLRPGVSTAQAAAEGTAAARSTVRPMAAELLFGAGGGPVVVHVRTLVDEMTARIRPALIVLAVSVVLVLLIACTNVANLFLSRGVARQRELTIRAAIGADRSQIARQLLTESAVLSALGGACGLGLAWALIRLLASLAMRDFPRLDDIRIDGRVMLFALAAAAFTALASGLAPALRGARVRLADTLRGGDGASAAGFRGARGRRLRDSLLVAEAAFAVMLLVAASLAGRSFARLLHVDAGYTAANMLAVEVFVPDTRSDPGHARLQASVATMRERLAGLPGVVAVGIGNMMPLDSSTMIAGFPAPGQPRADKPRMARAIEYIVTPGYAEALGLRLRGGRLFTQADLAGGVRPWIVNEEFARLYLPASPLGLRWHLETDGVLVSNEIVGIVGNVLKNGNDARPQPEIYQVPRPSLDFDTRFEIAIRTARDPRALAVAARRLVQELEPSAAIETATMADRVTASVDQPLFAMVVLAAFALLALTLASIGLYGALSYAVSQRRREIGVRAALGASRPRLLGLVLREGLVVTAAGLVLGIAGAAALTRLMRVLLFGISPLDGLSFAIAPALLVPVAVAACLVPARRAAATDPAEALRSE